MDTYIKNGIRVVMIDGREKSVARMVLETFSGPCENGIVHWKNRDKLDNHSINLRWKHKYIEAAINWGVRRDWIRCPLKQSRLTFLQSVRDFETFMSTGPDDAPDDVSVFGQPVYLKELNLTGLKEYLLSGLSKQEQTSIFKS